VSSGRADFEGARDDATGGAPLAERFRRHAAALARGRRSPLYIELMHGAAADLDAGGVVADLFDGIATPPGSVPPLRLLAALHRLVLQGRAPQLAAYCPSAGGALAPAGAWPAAAAVLRDHFAEVGERLALTVQTNEPGRAAVLFGALLWLHDRHELPVNLLEIGASGGLNLLADRYAYRVEGALLGAAGSPLVFDEPWVERPVPDPAAAARGLRISRRAGCDVAPLDLASADDRLTLRSYLWPDEPDRLDRIDAALAVAAGNPPAVAAVPAQRWLRAALADARPGELTVLWESVMRQYVAADAWDAIERTVAGAARAATAGAPLAWVAMEPGDDPTAGFVLTATTWPGGETHTLARPGDHGPPVRWRTPPPATA
jgi:hypothetical protein